MPIPESMRIEVIEKTNNRCCVCQTPFVQIHHIDRNPENNISDNLAPLCPNCHSQAHSHSNMYTNLTTERIRTIRNNWYTYCENRRQNLGSTGDLINLGTARLSLKNFDRSIEGIEGISGTGATFGWSRTFASLDPNYRTMTKDEIIDRVFSTSNRTDLKIFLETVRNMYVRAMRNPNVQERFREVCNAFGFDFDGRVVV